MNTTVRTSNRSSALLVLVTTVVLFLASVPVPQLFAQTNFYTYQSGDWGSATTWTTDASGITSVGAAIPAAIDNITILNGYTVTTGGANRTCASLTIASGGFLSIDNAAFAAHNFGTVSGQGTIRTVTGTIGGTANYTAFLGTSGGTFQFEATADFTLPGGAGNTTIGSTAVTAYRNLTLNLDVSTRVATIAQNTLNITGNLTLTRGTLQFNDATDRRVIVDVDGNINVAASGRIRVGLGNPLNVTVGTNAAPYSMIDDAAFNHPAIGQYHYVNHQLFVGGDFTNAGDVRFHNQTVRSYYQMPGLTRANGVLAAEEGAVNVFFNGAQNNTVTCNGSTQFYNLIVDKGTDKTYVLTVTSSAYANFELWGPVSASICVSGTNPYTSTAFTSTDQEVRRALWLRRGTLRLQGSTRIHTLTEPINAGGAVDNLPGTDADAEFTFPENAALWVDGGLTEVFTTTTTAMQTAFGRSDYETASIRDDNEACGMQVFGRLRVSNGFFSSVNANGGIEYRSDSPAEIIINGGVFDCAMLRGSGAGTTNTNFTMTGGVLYCRRNVTLTSLATLPGSGITLNTSAVTPVMDNGINDPSFDVDQTTGGFTMTGGQIHLAGLSGGALPEFRVNSDASSFNVTGGRILFRLASGNNAQIQAPTASLPTIEVRRESGLAGVTVTQETAITIIDSLIINDNATLVSANFNTSIGNSWQYGTVGSTASNAAFTAGTGTVTLGGITNSDLRIANTGTSPALTLNNLVINKTGGSNLDSLTLRSPGRAAGTIPVRVLGTTTLTAGDFNVLGYALSLQGNIVNGDTLTSLVSAGSVLTGGRVLLDGTAVQTLSGTSGVYGNLQVNKSGGSVTLGSTLSTTGELSLASATVLNAATFGIRIQNATGLVYGNAGGTALTDFGATRMIQFNGVDSDGGLTYGGTGTAAIAAGVSRLFPIGTNGGGRAARFTPALLTLSGTGTGTLTVNPVAQTTSNKLATLNGTFATNNAYSLYFRTRATSFTTLNIASTSTFRFPVADNTGGSDAAFVFGRVVGSARNDLSASSSVNTSADPRVVTTSAAIALTIGTDSRFTIGASANFTGTVKTFYSRQNVEQTLWTDANTWTSTTVGGFNAADPHNSSNGVDGGIPGPGDIAVIGFANGSSYPHNVFFQFGAGTATAAELQFRSDYTPGTLNGGPSFIDRPFFEIRGTSSAITAAFGKVTGAGTFGIGIYPAFTPPDISGIDFGEFNTNANAQFYIQLMGTPCVGGTLFAAHTYPASGTTTFPNLLINGCCYEGSLITFPNNITVNFDMKLDGGARVVLNSGASGDVAVTHDLNVGSNMNFVTVFPATFTKGAIMFQRNGTARTLSVGRDLLMPVSFAIPAQDSSLIWVDSIATGATAVAHQLIVGRNITGSSNRSEGLRLMSSTSPAVCNLTLNSTQNGTLSSVASTVGTYRFNNVTLNKGVTQVSNFSVNASSNLNGNLTLSNGTLILNNSSLAWNIVRTAAPAAFTIPTTAALTVTAGTAQFQSTLAAATNLILNGALTINGGNLLLNGNGTAEHSIEYGSASPALTISSGTLEVGGQIRQDAITSTGNLNYTQTGGTVTVGRNSAPQTERGVFEIESLGSSFTMSGGTLQLTRVNGAQLRPALYLDPTSSSVTGGEIIIGTDVPATPAASTFSIFTNGTVLPNLRVNSTNTPIARAITLPLSVQNLVVETGATFNANGQNIGIGGDLTVNTGSTYTANNVTTTFNRSAASNQTITNTGGTVTFGSLTMNRSAGNSLVAANNFTVNQNLTLTQGSFSTGTSTITILGNVTNNAGTTGHVSGTSGGLLLQGATAQNMGGSGTFGRVTINNTQGINATGNINVDGAAAANATFSLENGVMAMGSNFFNLSATANFASIPASSFSNTKMVSTSGSGVGGFSKTFTGTVAGYQIPIGVGTFYTPVTINFPSTSGGVFNIRPVNNITPAAQTPFDVLNYYWLVDATGFTAGTGTLVAEWPATITSPNFPTNYVPAQLQTAIATPGWVFGLTSDVTTGDPRTATFSFPAPGDATALTGQYTVGQTASLPAPITYTTTAAGTWETTGNWTPTPPAGGPQGALVVLNHAIDVTTLNRNALVTTVNGAGTLNVGTTVGHNFGNISGTGNIVIEPSVSGGSGLPPAGSYTGFTGTLQFTGANDFTLIGTALSNNWPGLNHNGSGVMTLQAGTVNVANTLTIGNSGAIDLTTNGTNITLQGNLVRSGSGTFTMGAANTLTLNGTGAQNINTGVGGMSVSNLTLNKASGATTITGGTGPLTINNNMDFISGIVTTTTSNVVANQVLNFADAATWTLNGSAFGFSNLTNCSPTSYVNGAVMKTISSANEFIFPTGNSVNGTSGGAIPFRPIRISSSPTAGTWVAVYFNTPHPTTTMAGGLQSLLTPREYWEINGPNSGTATVSTYWGCNSLTGTAVQADVDNGFRVINFNGANWVPVAGGEEAGSTPARGQVNTAVDFNFSVQTFGVGSTTGPLPVTWLYIRATAAGTHIALDWATGSEVNNNRFEVERSVDGRQFTKIGSVLGNGTTGDISLYAFQDVDYPQVRVLYYRLKQVDDNGEFAYSPMVEVMLEGGSANEKQWAIAPNPTNGEYFSLLVIGSGIDPLNDLHTVQLVSQQGSTLVNLKAGLNDVGVALRRALQNAPSGIYHLRVLSGKYSQSLKVVRE